MWAQIINIIAGLWVMIAPQLLSYGDNATDNGHITGPLIVTFAITALWDVNRQARWFNIPIGTWLLFAPWILDYNQTPAIVSDMLSGMVVILCSLMKGRINNRYGGGWRSLFSKNPEHARLQG